MRLFLPFRVRKLGFKKLVVSGGAGIWTWVSNCRMSVARCYESCLLLCFSSLHISVFTPTSETFPQVKAQDEFCVFFTEHLLVSFSFSGVLRIFLLIPKFPGVFCTVTVSGSQTYEFITICAKALGGLVIAGVPNLWNLMPDDLRWSWYNNSRNKGHSKCNVPKPIPWTPWSTEKLSSMKQVPGAKKDHWIIELTALWFNDIIKKPAIRGMPDKSIIEGSANFFSVKGRLLNILGFAGHTVWVVAS